MGKNKDDKKAVKSKDTSAVTVSSTSTPTKKSSSSSVLGSEPLPCSTLSDALHASYFKALCDRLGNTVSVEATPDKGKGLFARTTVEEGNILFLETPLGTLQHSANLARLCEYCKRFIGSLEYQLQPLLTVQLNSAQRASLDKDTARDLENTFRLDNQALSSSSSVSVNGNLGISSSSAVSSSTLISVTDNQSSSFDIKNYKLPVVDDTYLTDIVDCSAGCDTQYCSKECRDLAWRKYHSILCTGTLDEDEDDDEEDSNVNASNVSSHVHNTRKHHHHHHDEHCTHNHEEEISDHDDDDGEEDNHHHHHADDDNDDENDEANINIAALFRQQALATNEIFLLAGRMICRILETWVRNGNDMEKALIPFKVLHAEPWTLIFTKQQLGIKGLTKINASSSGATKSTNNSSFSHSNTATTEEEYDEEQYILQTQQQILEWVRDSATILRQLVEQRLPAYVDLIEMTSSVSSIHSSGSSSTGKQSDTAASTSSQTSIVPDASSSSSSSIPKQSRTVLTPTEIQFLFDPENYEVLIGAFELNNIEMKIDSPLRDYMSIIASLPKTIPEKGTSDNSTVSPYHQAVSVLSPYLRRVVAAEKARKQLTKAVRAFTGEDDNLDDDDDDEDDDEEDEIDDDEAGISANPGAKHKHHSNSNDDDDDDEANDSDYEPNDNEEDDDDDDDDDDDEEEEEGATYIDLPEDNYGGPLRVPLRLFPIASGTGLFSIQCCANHSCDPNVQLCYIQGNCTGAFMALEDIKAGDELFINYVDIEQDVKDRQDELAHYGFLCQCPRCIEELRVRKLSLKKWSKTL